MSKAPLPDHYDDLDAALKTAWRVLSDGARRSASSCHVVNVATLGRDQTPRIRSVVLRGVDQAERKLRFHTDLRSEKAREIALCDSVAVHVYAPDQKIQLRMACRAKIHHGDAVSREAWRTSQDMSKECYGQVEGPGTVLPASGSAAFDHGNGRDAGYRNFAAVIAHVETLEWLFLAAVGHRRAHFDWRDGAQTAVWLAP